MLFKDWIELVPMERIRKFVTFMIILEDSTVMIELNNFFSKEDKNLSTYFFN